RASRRVDPAVDRLRAAVPVFRSAAGDHPALHVRRRVVCAADLPRARAWRLAAEAHGRGDDAGAAVGGVVAPRSGGPLDTAVTRRPECGLDAASSRGTGGCRAESAT